MSRFATLVIAAMAAMLTAAGCAQEKKQSEPVPGGGETAAAPLLTGNGVGSLTLGLAVDSVGVGGREVVRDTTIAADEGMSARVMTVALSGDTVDAEIVQNRVWRIQVLTPRIRTADSLGVGTSLATLLRLPGVRPLTGEGRLFVTSPAHCGLSFQIPIPTGKAAIAHWDSTRLRSLPGNTGVSRVLVTGCPQ